MAEEIFRIEMEIKVRLACDFRKWDEIPYSFRTRELNKREFEDTIRSLRELVEAPYIQSVRWNEKGSPNGNYFVSMFDNTPVHIRQYEKDEIENVELTPVN